MFTRENGSYNKFEHWMLSLRIRAVWSEASLFEAIVSFIH